MPTPTSDGIKTIFGKTDKGRAEIVRRSHQLNPRQRQALILFDGVKPLDAIAALIPAPELNAALAFLTRHGLIAPADSKAGPAEESAAMAPAAASRERIPTGDPDTLKRVKDFMATTAHTYLGLLSAEVIQRIERARDGAQLMGVVGHWHMALCDSKQGARCAGPALEKVKRALFGDAAP